MRRRSTLTINGRRENFDVDRLGRSALEALSRPVSRPLGALAASIYWRSKGNAPEAIECLRMGLENAPFSKEGLLTLADIFHRSGRSEDAVNVAKMALRNDDDEEDKSAVYFILGNIEASLMRFDEAVSHFEAASRDLDEARIRLHAVRCQSKAEDALSGQRRKLDGKLRRLRTLKGQHAEWRRLAEKTASEQASFQTRVESKMAYEQIKILSSADGRGVDCVQYETPFGQEFISCSMENSIQDQRPFLDEFLKEDRIIEAKVEDVQRRLVELDDIDITCEFDEVDEDQEPTLEPLYAAFPDEDETSLYGWSQRSSFPLDIECHTPLRTVPIWSDYPTVFLSPENKGFE